MELSKCRLVACAREIYSLMLPNRLKLNKDKTELFVISSVHRARPPLIHIHVCEDERVLASPKASNIGVPFDESLSMVPQATAICKSALYHLRKISLVNILPLMQLLRGVPKHLIKQFQRVQNAAAPAVTVSPKPCHITPVLAHPHLLPIELRIEFQILTITYKTLQDLAPSFMKGLLQRYHPP